MVQGTGARLGRYPLISLTRLTFIAPDGTEYELRDTLTGGRPVTHAAANQVARGQVFMSAGGEGIIFVADAPIFDILPDVHADCPALFYPAGYLYFPDGTQYRVNSTGDIEYIRDANGNAITYLYDSSHRVTRITDSLNRQDLITYDNPASVSYETYDDISYQSDENTWRHVKVYRTALSHALRSGSSITSIAALFPSLTGLSDELYNPSGLATRVELPDNSNRNYKLFYNPYGVLARVEVPTGGAVEYDRAAPEPWGVTANRPIRQRRVYAEGGSLAQSTPPDQKQVYSWEKSPYSNPQRTSKAIVETYARTLSANGQLTEQLQNKEVHSYYGWPDVQRRAFYGPWREGLEFKSEAYAPNSTTPIRRTEIEWEQPFPVSWVTPTQQGQSPETSPNNNPRTKSVTTWLMDANSNLVSRQVFGYDNNSSFRAFNNRTDVWEYAFGNGAPSDQLMRHTQTKYLLTDATPEPTPSPSANPSPTPPDECIHCPCRDNCRMTGDSVPTAQEYAHQNLTKLPTEVRIYGVVNNQEQLQARTEVVYDERSLWPRNNITGWVDPGSAARGNVTTVKTWTNPTDDNAFTRVLSEYDVAGNVIQTTDSNNAEAVAPKVTQIIYTDCFGTAETGLDFAKARYYGDSLGRFTSVDPAGNSARPMVPQSWNRYTYVLNNPINIADPSGMDWRISYQTINGQRFAVPEYVNCTGCGNWRQKYGDIFTSPDGKWTALNPFENEGADTSFNTRKEAEAAFASYKNQATVNFLAGFFEALSLSTKGIAKLSQVSYNTNSEKYKEGYKWGEIMSYVRDGAGLASGVTLGAVVLDKGLSKALSRIITSYRGANYCDRIAKLMMKAFKKSGIEGEIITLVDREGAPILKNLAGDIMSTDGTHQVVRVGEKYFDELTGAAGATWEEYLKLWHADTAPYLKPK